MATADRSRPARPGRLTVVVTSPDGSRMSSRGLARWLAQAAPSRARGEITVALVSDTRMRALNRAFRGKDYATDVLSFPADARPFLGDVAIATGVARRQAGEAGHSFTTELRVLALHGLLHLLGYDHERDAGAMERAEARLRKAAGLSEGLIERGSRAEDREGRTKNDELRTRNDDRDTKSKQRVSATSRPSRRRKRSR